MSTPATTEPPDAPASSPSTGDLRAVRALLRGAHPGGSGAYGGYIAALVLAIYSPALWWVLAADGRALVRVLGGTDPLLALLPVTTLLAFVAAAAAQRLGVLRTSAPEVEFLLRGQFRPRAVFARRR